MQLFDKVVSWDSHFVDSIGSSIFTRLDTWLASHPLLYWLVNHSLISLVVGLVVTVLLIRLLLTIYHSIASTIDKMWLWVLRSPFMLLKVIFGWEVKSKNDSINTSITNYEVTNNPELLGEVMARLEHIQQQQQQIVEDITLLKQRSLDVNATEVNLQLVKKELPPAIDNKA